MKTELNELSINGVKYVPADSVSVTAIDTSGLKYCIVRTYSAGVFAGFVKSQNGKEVIILNARRIWYWTGAASLSQLAMEGTSNPKQCKFPCEVTEITLTEAIEIIPCTEKARKSIAEVAIWKQ